MKTSRYKRATGLDAFVPDNADDRADGDDDNSDKTTSRHQPYKNRQGPAVTASTTALMNRSLSELSSASAVCFRGQLPQCSNVHPRLTVSKQEERIRTCHQQTTGGGQSTQLRGLRGRALCSSFPCLDGRQVAPARMPTISRNISDDRRGLSGCQDYD